MHGAMAEDLFALAADAGGIVKVADQGSRCPSRVASPKSDEKTLDRGVTASASIRLMCGYLKIALDDWGDDDTALMLVVSVVRGVGLDHPAHGNTTTPRRHATSNHCIIRAMNSNQ